MGGRGASSNISSVPTSNRMPKINSGDKEIDRITKRLLNDKEMQKTAFSERTQKRLGVMQDAKKDISRLSKQKDGLFSNVVFGSKASADKLKSLKNEYKNIDKVTEHNIKQRDYWTEKGKEWSKKDPTRIEKKKWGDEIVYSARSQDAFFKASSLNNIITHSAGRKESLERQIKGYYSDYEKKAKSDVERAYKLKNYAKKQKKK